MLQEGIFNWDPAMMGLVLSAFFYGYAATQIPCGMIADKFGGKRLMFFGLALMSLLTLLTPIITVSGGIIALFVIRVIEGLSSVSSDSL